MSIAELFLPRRTGWMLPEDALDAIVEVTEQHQPRLVLEAGSGRSTVVLAAALAGRSRLVSLENDPKFKVETASYISRNGLDADVRLAPMEWHDGVGAMWYARSGWDDLDGIDMLIVDGPLGATGPLARWPALPLLRNRLSEDAIVVLDDTHRRDEQEIICRWDLADVVRVPHSGGAFDWGRLAWIRRSRRRC